MATENGPDLAQGVSMADFGENGMLAGHVGEDAVLLARVGDDIFAVGNTCTHYGGPLADGLLAGDTVHCPWHHAAFSVRTGEAVQAPAFDSLPRWKVEREGDRIFVRGKADDEPAASAPATQPERIVIVGGGAAGFACAEMLRRRGHAGTITMLSADADAPCDRPNLSKDYLAGDAPEEWIPLKPNSFFAEEKIDLRLGTPVARIDTGRRVAITTKGEEFPFDRLLLATGANAIHLDIPGADQPHVFTLHTLADSRAIIDRAKAAKTAVVLGSSFIGLEVAAALRKRGLDVHVVSLDKMPLERVLGPELGHHIRKLHEKEGVHFHFETSISEIGATDVALKDGSRLPADLVILGIGVRPETTVAEASGLAVDKGVLVNEYLETAVDGIYAAGDIARWQDGRSGERQRIEHWVLAERHGQVVAENMLGAKTPFTDAPFFWSAHYDTVINYVGHGVGWDATEIEGDIDAGDCVVRYKRDGKTIAAATIGRDVEALKLGETLGG